MASSLFFIRIRACQTLFAKNVLVRHYPSIRIYSDPSGICVLHLTASIELGVQMPLELQLLLRQVLQGFASHIRACSAQLHKGSQR